MTATSGINIPVSKSSYVKILAQIAIDNGLNINDLLKEANLPSDILLANEVFIPSKSMNRFFYLISEQFENKQFFQLLRITIRDKFVPLPLNFFAGKKTLKQALEMMHEVFKRVSPSSEVHIQKQLSQYWLCIQVTETKEQYVEWIELFSIILVQELISKLTGKTWQPQALKIISKSGDLLVHALPNTKRLFTNQSSIALCIEPEQLSLPITISGASKQVNTANEWHSSYIDNAFELLKPYVRENNLSIEFAAKVLNITVRTLQRRLLEHKTSFRNLKENLMLSVAYELIEEGRSFTYIASQLGYADLAHFSRAFKRRSGLTPKQYKQFHQQSRESSESADLL